MTTINRLSALDELVSADLLPVYSSANGDARKASMSVIKEYIEDGLTAADDKVTQYEAPSATGFTVTVTDSSASAWLLLTPAGAYANGTIILPAVANCVDRQEILVTSTQAITALVVDGNGATVTGGPSTMAQNGFFTLRFDTVASTWYRVG